jgi:hypothetical protein
LIEEPTAKEERYCRKMKIEIIRDSVGGLLQAAGASTDDTAELQAMQGAG